MDQNEHQTFIKSTKCHFMKTFLQFLISISLFSLLLSYPSGLYIFYHFRKFIYPLFTHDIESKYMFVICNGLLIFVSRNLNSSSSSRVGSEYNISEDEDGGKSASELSETKAPVVNKRAAIENVALVAEEEAEEEEEEEDGTLNTEVGEIGALVIEKEEDKFLIAEEEEEKFLIAEEEEEAGAVNKGEGEGEGEEGEEEEEGNEELLNTEELNKKFDEFIRRMKEELRLDAQRQLIAV